MLVVRIDMTPSSSNHQQLNQQIDVTVIGGVGHVGLPLCLAIAATGKRVMMLDTNEEALKTVSEGKLPHMEADAEPVLKQALDRDLLAFSSHPADIPAESVVILTIGTPIDEFLNPEYKAIRDCVDDILPYLIDAQLLILRSTIYPGTTDWLAHYLEKKGRQLRIAFCPERVIQGHSLEELRTMPQLVSGVSRDAEDAAAAFFEELAPKVVKMSPKEAEFAKLFSNAYRYIEFAAANQLYMIANAADVDFYRIHAAVTDEYDRMKTFPRAGFAAGPCLFKDTMQLAAFAKNQFSLGHNAMLVNEGLVLYVIEELAKQHPDLAHMTVGLLGMAFKADSDDTRSSLSYKLKKALELRCNEVICTDPFVTDDERLVSAEHTVERSDVLVLCTPHTIYQDLDLKDRPVLDIWGFYGP